MHSKIIRPGQHEKVVYDNKGSSKALVHYLGHEAREHGQNPAFFTGTEEGISPETVQAKIDGNVKGLRKNEVKFYSLVISPGPQELRHMGEDKEKLTGYTRKVMENYAAHFSLPNGKKLKSDELVWFATLHQHRTYKGNEEEVKAGNAKSGEQKGGPNAHIHVIVSKRDSTQTITLNPQGSKDRFSMQDWQKTNEQTFDKLFAYGRKAAKATGRENQAAAIASQAPAKASKATGKATKAALGEEKVLLRVQKKLVSINQMLPKGEKLPLEKVLEIGREKQFNQTFFRNLYRVGTSLKAGRVLRDPLHLLTHNRDSRPALPKAEHLGRELRNVLNTLGRETASNGFTENLSMPLLEGRRHRPRRSKRTSSGLSL